MNSNGTPENLRPRPRQKGSTNLVSRSLKAALMRTFEEIGGEDELVAWAKVNPGEFYKMWVKWLPRTIRGDAEHPVSFKVVFSPCGQEVDDLPQIERGGEFRESREER